MNSDGSYEPPSLQPLILTPEILAQAQQQQIDEQQLNLPPPMQQPSQPPSAEQINELQAMFPDFDTDVLASVLQISGNAAADAADGLVADALAALGRRPADCARRLHARPTQLQGAAASCLPGAQPAQSEAPAGAPARSRLGAG